MEEVITLIVCLLVSSIVGFISYKEGYKKGTSILTEEDKKLIKGIAEVFNYDGEKHED